MKQLFGKLRNRPIVIVHDLLMIPVAWLGAYWLRFDIDNFQIEYLWVPLRNLPVIFAVQGSLLWYFGLYRGVWRFASMPDLLRILKAVSAGIVLSLIVLFMFQKLTYIPRSIFVLDGLLLIILLGGPRFIYRWIKDQRLYGREVKNALIVGAGRAGEMLVRDLLRDQRHTYQPVGFVDDDKGKQGKDIHGVRVAGVCEDIPALAEELEVDLVLIALSSVTPRRMQRVVELCEATGLPFRTLPHMQDLVTGQVSINDLREVNINDLLGRDSVSLDWTAITRGVQGKTIFVTGGGGSIGSELCRQVARLEPARLVIFEQSEFNLYSIEHDLKRLFPSLEFTALLGDICDSVAVEQALRTYQPTIILHTAAYKHVPMLEHQIRAAVNNNVFGTITLASLANRYGCSTFVMISTDKAVNPANIMGMTKRVAEIYCQNQNVCSTTHYITVRFGNVLGSTGSVIPLFQKQIAAGGPVTVTHPEITRYFMTISEAAQLILQASTMGKGGEIYVLDMGEPVKISYLAEQLIRLSGKKPGEDVEITYTGLRPGEKLYEELFHETEMLAGTTHPKILLANSRSMAFAQLEQAIEMLVTACDECDEQRIIRLLSELVPEHQSRLFPNGTVEIAGNEQSAVVIPLKNPGRPI